MSADATVDRLEYSEQWRVRTFELDSNGHVNNAVYLNYAEQVAADHAEALGFGRDGAERHQVAWAVREHHVVYHRPAVYRDLLRLTTRVQAMSGVRATATPPSGVNPTGSCWPRSRPSGSASSSPSSGRPASRPT